MSGPTWVFDSSSLIQIKSRVPIVKRPDLFDRLSALVAEGRLRMPKQVVDELRRGSDATLKWAIGHEAAACAGAADLDEVRAVLLIVPDVIDPDKEQGPDEADPYVLAMAIRLRRENVDARIVTEEVRDTLRKTSLNSAAGIVGVPCLPLAMFLRVERLL